MLPRPRRPPRAYYYDYFPRTVVYRDYPRYYYGGGYVARGYYHSAYRGPAYSARYYRGGGGYYHGGGSYRGHGRH